MCPIIYVHQQPTHIPFEWLGALIMSSASAGARSGAARPVH